MDEVTLREVIDPEAEVDAVAACAALNNLVCSADTGHDDLSTWTIAEASAMLRDTDRPTRLVIATAGDEVVGALTTSHDAEAQEVLDFDLMVDPDHRGRGIEERLLEAVVAAAADAGLSTLQTWSLHRATTPRRPLSPAMGVGVIPGEDRYAAFLQQHGFALEQVERNSRFDLHDDGGHVASMLREALDVAQDDYAVVSWTDAVPDDLAEGYAWILSRMSTDPPAGGMTLTEETWDVARVRRREERLRAQELFVSVTAAVHRATGTVAAYNELAIGTDRTKATQQHGTLVVREHRGHRLGIVVKAAGLLRWRELVPESPHVTTFNAEENRYMLAINEQLGFTPASYAGAWQRIDAAGVAGSAGRSGSTGS